MEMTLEEFKKQSPLKLIERVAHMKTKWVEREPQKTKTKMIKIGIDPDTEKSGIAILPLTTRKLLLKSLTFFELFDFLKKNKETITEVVIEAGWLNQKSNFHGYQGGRAERIAKNVGANHETGRKIAEMCKYLNIKHRLIKPLPRKWNSPSGKIAEFQFMEVLKENRIVLEKSRTNQDERDSAMILISTLKKL